MLLAFSSKEIQATFSENYEVMEQLQQIKEMGYSISYGEKQREPFLLQRLFLIWMRNQLQLSVQNALNMIQMMKIRGYCERSNQNSLPSLTRTRAYKIGLSYLRKRPIFMFFSHIHSNGT